MAFDPVHQIQLGVRRSGELLRRNGVVPAQSGARQHLEGEERERFYDGGEKQLAQLTAAIEDYTGFTLEGRRALDFGCGVGRLALPLAKRCEHVYGLDVSDSILEAADRNAKRMGLENVEWLMPDGLPQLSGHYDLVVSHFVFQHIPSREGERVFTMLVQGLRPGGAGALHFTLRPRLNPRQMVRALGYWYQLMNSYSLDRLGRLLAAEGITVWHVRRFEPRGQYPTATIIFRKD